MRKPPWAHAALHWVWETHAGCANRTFGGAPHGATKRYIGWGRCKRTAPLGPSVEIPTGPRNAVLGGGDACELRHWDL
eukprot:8720811-Pyramimonas_sp.AAC.1